MAAVPVNTSMPVVAAEPGLHTTTMVTTWQKSHGACITAVKDSNSSCLRFARDSRNVPGLYQGDGKTRR